MISKAKYMKRIILSVLLFFNIVYFVQAQQPPFYANIQEFKKQDSAQAPPQHPIVFVGSSSFTIWKTVQADFPGYPIVNRGFGGSTLPDVIRFADDVILRYQPKQVIIYCGDNDLASSDNVTADTVVTRFKKLYGIIRQALPNTVIDYVSIKPSPSREKLLPQIIEANKEISEFLEKDPKAGYIDVYSAMLDSQGKIKSELFQNDMLHMKRNGYEIWKRIIAPYLVK